MRGLATSSEGAVLLARARSRLCALPLRHVEETMRPLPVRPVPGVPAWVVGLAVVRGEPVPVVHAAGLFDEGLDPPARFVLLKAGVRRIALAVDEVIGVANLPEARRRQLPPLAARLDEAVIREIGVLDAELLTVLDGSRLVPDGTWAQLSAARPEP